MLGCDRDVGAMEEALSSPHRWIDSGRMYGEVRNVQRSAGGVVHPVCVLRFNLWI